MPLLAIDSDKHALPFVSKEKQLIKFLLDRYAEYGRIGRPVINTSEVITVNFGLSLVQILKVDEKNQVLETNVWETFVRNIFPWNSIDVNHNYQEFSSLDPYQKCLNTNEYKH